MVVSSIVALFPFGNFPTKCTYHNFIVNIVLSVIYKTIFAGNEEWWQLGWVEKLNDSSESR